MREERSRRREKKRKMAAEEGKNTYVATVVRDDFFNDPFFKNWWADFDKPMTTWDKTFNRQISGKQKT